MTIPRLRFAYPKRRRLVYLGATGNSLLGNYIKEESSTTYRSVRDECNVWVALFSVIFGRWSARGYYQSFLRMVRPSIVITFEDNSLEFYLTKAYRPECTTLCIQNGRRDTYSTEPDANIWQLIRDSVSPNLAPDVVATHGEPWSMYFREALGQSRTTVIAIGSVRNNALPIGERRQAPRLLFVSSFPNIGAEGELEGKLSTLLGYWQGVPVTFGQFYQLEGLIAQTCADIARTRGVRFGVLGKRPSWQKGELSYFSNALSGSEWFFLASETEASSYAAVTDSDVLVNIDSTFGYEMLARGVRVAFVSARMQHAGLHHIKDCEFGYPMVTQPTGPFWTNQATSEEINRVVNYLIDASTEEWESVSRQLRESVMPFDFGNAQLCSLLTSLGIKTGGKREWSLDDVPKN